MSLKRRLRRLEAAHTDTAFAAVPWFVEDEAEGFVFRGERLTWQEYERRHPEGRRPLRWLDLDELDLDELEEEPQP